MADLAVHALGQDLATAINDVDVCGHAGHFFTTFEEAHRMPGGYI